MKKVLVLLCVFVAVFGIATALRAGMTAPGVLNTPHDVQVMTGETGLEPCAMCHSPHATGSEYPIWNRDQAAQSYQMYSSATFDMQTVPQPDRETLPVYVSYAITAFSAISLTTPDRDHIKMSCMTLR